MLKYFSSWCKITYLGIIWYYGPSKAGSQKQVNNIINFDIAGSYPT